MSYTQLEYENLVHENAILRKCLAQREEELLAMEARLVECRDNHPPLQFLTDSTNDGDGDDASRPVYLYKLIKKDCYHPHNHEQYQYLFVRWRTSRAIVAHQLLRHRYPFMKILLEIGRSVKEVNFANEVQRALGKNKIKVCYNAVYCAESDEAMLLYTVLSLRSSFL